MKLEAHIMFAEITHRDQVGWWVQGFNQKFEHVLDVNGRMVIRQNGEIMRAYYELNPCEAACAPELGGHDE